MSRKSKHQLKINKDSTVVLYVLEGACGMPSIDPFTSDLLYNIKLHKCHNIKVRTSRFSIFPNLPYLIMDNNIHFKHPAVIKRLIDNYTNDQIDIASGSLNMSRIKAYKEMSFKYIENAVLLAMWGTEENRLVSLRNYGHSIFGPMKFLFTRNLRKKMTDTLEYLAACEPINILIHNVYAEASNVLEDFSNLLGDKPFIFGDHPTTLDINLCSYLAPIVLIKYPDQAFYNIISQYPNLLIYVKRFVQTYGDKNTPDKGATVADEDRASPTLIFTAGAIAISAMMGYAVIKGIIKT